MTSAPTASHFRRPARGGILLPVAAVHTLCEYEDKLGCIFSSNVTLRAEILVGGDITSIFLHILRKFTKERKLC